MVQVKTIADLCAELESLMAEHAVAERACQEAERQMTDVRNRINRAQKAIDEAIEATRKVAPWNTDWHSRRNPGVRVGTAD